MVSAKGIGYGILAAGAAGLIASQGSDIDPELRHQMTDLILRTLCAGAGLPSINDTPLQNRKIFVACQSIISTLPFLPLLFPDKQSMVVNGLACFAPVIANFTLRPLLKGLDLGERDRARMVELVRRHMQLTEIQETYAAESKMRRFAPLDYYDQEFIRLKGEIEALRAERVAQPEADGARLVSHERMKFPLVFLNINNSFEYLRILYSTIQEGEADELQHKFLLQSQKVIEALILMESSTIDEERLDGGARFVLKYNVGRAVLNVMHYLRGSMLARKISEPDEDHGQLLTVIIRENARAADQLQLGVPCPFGKFMGRFDGEFGREQTHHELMEIVERSKNEVRRRADALGEETGADFKKIIRDLAELVEQDYKQLIGANAGAGAGAGRA